jgi:hypothetical protein
MILLQIDDDADVVFSFTRPSQKKKPYKWTPHRDGSFCGVKR